MVAPTQYVSDKQQASCLESLFKVESVCEPVPAIVLSPLLTLVPRADFHLSKILKIQRNAKNAKKPPVEVYRLVPKSAWLCA